MPESSEHSTPPDSTTPSTPRPISSPTPSPSDDSPNQTSATDDLHDDIELENRRTGGHQSALSKKDSNDDVDDPTHEPGDEPTFRFAVELVIGLILANLIVRTFVAEPFLVPTGSMAPTVLGNHKRMVDPQTGEEVVVDAEQSAEGPIKSPQSQRPIDFSTEPIVPGETLLVNKFAYTFRDPKRWELAVFLGKSQAQPSAFEEEKPRLIHFIKRVVGLPGETVDIINGDVYINGKIARKSLRQALAMAIPVFRQDWATPEQGRLNWRAFDKNTSAGLEISPQEIHLLDDDIGPAGRPKRLYYRHHTPNGNVAAIRNTYVYNGTRFSPQDAADVDDLIVQADVLLQWNDEADPTIYFELELRPKLSQRCRLRLLPKLNRVELWQRLEPEVPTTKPVEYVRVREAPLSAPRDEAKGYSVTLARVDRTWQVALDGVMPFAPVELPRAKKVFDAGSREPVSLAVRGVSAWVRDFRIGRDVHYTDRIENAVLDGNLAGVDHSYQLEDDAFFMLGDNSPISNDSRAWEHPGIKRKLVVGKPVLVHLPVWVYRGQWWGRDVEWHLPDWNRIRRVH